MSIPNPSSWRFRLGHLAWLGAALLAASALLVTGPGRDGDGWYQLVGPIPGERVPEWLHTGRTYRGRLVPGGRSVQLSEPDSGRSAVIRASLLVEVPIREV